MTARELWRILWSPGERGDVPQLPREVDDPPPIPRPLVTAADRWQDFREGMGALLTALLMAPLSLGVLVFMGLLAWGVVRIIFRHAYGIELWDPVQWWQS